MVKAHAQCAKETNVNHATNQSNTLKPMILIPVGTMQEVMVAAGFKEFTLEFIETRLLLMP